MEGGVTVRRAVYELLAVGIGMFAIFLGVKTPKVRPVSTSKSKVNIDSS